MYKNHRKINCDACAKSLRDEEQGTGRDHLQVKGAIIEEVWDANTGRFGYEYLTASVDTDDGRRAVPLHFCAPKCLAKWTKDKMDR